ncbi:Uu.00g042380.m01.CDS01 [Anthostomella pinea]|uniref:Uu.00g042380.m01.CDS01 n=1 Tax=Anthostomella pinea TaxID=933095 RepID=A0AAI8VBI4_9PEZI|nr:Uu.00g042380.m01.CDS01 [Anthostomella pinea]
MATYQPPNQCATAARTYTGISANYSGDLGIQANIPQSLEDEGNTALWIMGLPSYTSHTTMLAAIRSKGPIKSLHINGPTDEHPNTSAAKSIFFEHRHAAKLKAEATRGEYKFGDAKPNIFWNRYGSREDPAAGRSRVLRIEGAEALITRQNLEALWSTSMWWDVDYVHDIGYIGGGRAVVWYYFGSWRCQAAKAKGITEGAYGCLVSVVYGRDPCAVPRRVN